MKWDFGFKRIAVIALPFFLLGCGEFSVNQNISGLTSTDTYKSENGIIDLDRFHQDRLMFRKVDEQEACIQGQIDKIANAQLQGWLTNLCETNELEQEKYVLLFLGPESQPLESSQFYSQKGKVMTILVQANRPREVSINSRRTNLPIGFIADLSHEFKSVRVVKVKGLTQAEADQLNEDFLVLEDTGRSPVHPSSGVFHTAISRSTAAFNNAGDGVHMDFNKEGEWEVHFPKNGFESIRDIPTMTQWTCAANKGLGLREWNGFEYSECQVNTCDDGYHIEKNACQADQKSCADITGTGVQNWSGQVYDRCQYESCQNDYHLHQARCLKKQVVRCQITNASKADKVVAEGIEVSACQVKSCNSGYSLFNNLCHANQKNCSAANATSALQTWTGSTYGPCEVKACGTGYLKSGNSCVAKSKSCSAANAASASQTWSGTRYGACQITSCKSGFAKSGNFCVAKIKSCSAANATSASQTWSGTRYGACQITSCKPGFAKSGNQCVVQTRSCSAVNASSAFQQWTGSSYGTCQIKTCLAEYHLVSNRCLANLRSCTIKYGSGTQKWRNGSWSSCQVSACTSGYHIEGGRCLANIRSCGTVDNASHTQPWLGSSYGSCKLICDKGFQRVDQMCARSTAPVIPVNFRILAASSGQGSFWTKEFAMTVLADVTRKAGYQVTFKFESLTQVVSNAGINAALGDSVQHRRSGEITVSLIVAKDSDTKCGGWIQGLAYVGYTSVPSFALCPVPRADRKIGNLSAIFLHEFGHNMGYSHSGATHADNYDKVAVPRFVDYVKAVIKPVNNQVDSKYDLADRAK